MAVSDQINWNNWIYRLIAYIIDSIIIGIPAYIIYWLLLLPLATTTVNYGYGYSVAVTAWWANLLIPLVLGVLQLFYFIIMDSNSGGTFGKRIMKLQVQTVNGSKLTINQAFIRNISKIYGLLLLLDWLIGIVSAGNKQQKFLDRAASAVVVQRGQPFAAAQTDYPPPPPPPPA
jgi:uncharacterized RDD family membrane protein YckC